MTGSYFSNEILSYLTNPNTLEPTDVIEKEGQFQCAETGEEFPVLDGVPSFLPRSDKAQNEVTSSIKDFYEEFPFPSYEGLQEFGELVSRGYSSDFSKSLLKAIGYNKKVLECGCGTGQLSHFLQLNNNQVLGIDLSTSSLKLALEHKRRNQLTRSNFAQMNIFNLAIKDESFDVVISHGVLHHTYDARLAFSHIVRKLKPGGFILIGLYNSYARAPTWIRSKLIGTFGPNLDYVVRKRIHDQEKANIWIKDQYYNPHETWHSIDDAMDWFEENDIEYLATAPHILGTDSEEYRDLFSKSDPGTKYQRIITQLFWLNTIAREGALFDVIGRKKD